DVVGIAALTLHQLGVFAALHRLAYAELHCSQSGFGRPVVHAGVLSDAWLLGRNWSDRARRPLVQEWPERVRVASRARAVRLFADEWNNAAPRTERGGLGRQEGFECERRGRRDSGPRPRR